MAGGVHTIDKEKFFEAYDRWLSEKLSFKKCAEIAGVSIPTLQKYFAVVITGGEFPDTLFEKKTRRKKK